MNALTGEKLELLRSGTVIPAHPLALDSNRQLSARYQRALTRYYIDAGAGGIAVGVHSTQFEIRDPGFGLYEPVLKLAAEEADRAGRPFLKIAGVCGPIEQALAETDIARGLAYDMALLSMGNLGDISEEEHLDRVAAVAGNIPVFGFYLQPSVGGRVFSYDFWKSFSEIPNVLAIKTAPFNRYYTLDVVRAVCSSSRRDMISIYTGNDDNIINDLLTTYSIYTHDGWVEKDIVGGLLGHWAVWTKKAVEMFNDIKAHKKAGGCIDSAWLTKNIQVTDANAAFFDPAHQFRGCISGIHEVLLRQGLMETILCLSDHEQLSPGQSDEIDRVYAAYPDLNDDDFVRENLAKWLG
ncbi:MAG: dihydrodipicolinate synthase family protein [Clostridia bacterium]|nr:dihydrodipicolinate synthase family protein [Clostridia bacterium]